MTTPDVPRRLAFSVEVPGTPEQVWEAIATAKGMSGWFVRTDLEEREGGALFFHMGDEGGSPGTVSEWEPPRRLVYEEPEWAALAGHEGAATTPLVSEFVVEAQDGGTCIVRVVSRAFGTGADWEDEFFAEMERGWLPMFDQLAVYLTHFGGREARNLAIMKPVPRAASEIRKAVADHFGLDAPGQTVEVDGLSAVVERLDADRILLRLTDPVPGMLAFILLPAGDDQTVVGVNGYYFADDADAHAARETTRWQDWIDRL